jgi:hypothetical protein
MTMCDGGSDPLMGGYRRISGVEWTFTPSESKKSPLDSIGRSECPL